MKLRLLYALIFVVALSAHSQTTADPEPGLPKDPREILAAAAPYYDFASPEMKPWYLKATYQLYNQDGKPTETGTYERWWVSPKVFRESWTRPGAKRTEWHTAEGKHLFKATGQRLRHFELELESALFSPLPGKAALNPEQTRLGLEMKSLKGSEFPCISLVPMRTIPSQLLPFGLGPTYCFDEHVPVLRARFDSGILTTEFNNIAKVQDRFLAREILILGTGRKLFSAEVEAVGGMDSSDPVLTPGLDAVLIDPKRTQQGAGALPGQLIKKEAPIYPLLAKRLGQRGTVVIQGTIGIDGKVHDSEVLFAPSELLAASALEAVSHWKYRPYSLNGEPVEVETTINVFFALGQ